MFFFIPGKVRGTGFILFQSANGTNQILHSLSSGRRLSKMLVIFKSNGRLNQPRKARGRLRGQKLRHFGASPKPHRQKAATASPFARNPARFLPAPLAQICKTGGRYELKQTHDPKPATAASIVRREVVTI